MVLNFFEKLKNIFLPDEARRLMQWFYASAFYIIFRTTVDYYPSFSVSSAVFKENLVLWPVSWVTFFDQNYAITAIFGLALAASFFAVLSPERRISRICCFIAIFEIVALVNSDGAANHPLYLWIPASFLLIFLADGAAYYSNDKKDAARFFYVFWACQAVILLSYSMAGLGKFISSVLGIFKDEITLFSLQAGALHIADNLVRTPGFNSVLGAWLVEHYMVAWLLLLGTMYLELFSFVVAFRPYLYRYWSSALILMHIGILMVMGPNFLYQVMLVSIFFLWPPFNLEKRKIHEVVFDVPVWGRWLKLFFRESD